MLCNMKSIIFIPPFITKQNNAIFQMLSGLLIRKTWKNHFTKFETLKKVFEQICKPEQIDRT